MTRTGGSGQEVFEISRAGSGQEVFQTRTGRVEAVRITLLPDPTRPDLT